LVITSLSNQQTAPYRHKIEKKLSALASFQHSLCGLCSQISTGVLSLDLAGKVMFAGPHFATP